MNEHLIFIQHNARACVRVPLTETLASWIQASLDAAKDTGMRAPVAFGREMQDILGWPADMRMNAWPEGEVTLTWPSVHMCDALHTDSEEYRDIISERTHVGRLIWSERDEDFVVVDDAGDAIGGVGWFNADTYEGVVNELFIEYAMGVDERSNVHLLFPIGEKRPFSEFEHMMP